MLIEQLMTKEPGACGPGDTLAHAAQIMWERDCGSLPVCADDGSGRVIGMITDRDICMCAHFQGRCLPELRVAEAIPAGKELRTLSGGDSPADAVRMMREARVRRLPVVDGNGALIGVVSLADLAREAARAKRQKKKQVISEAEVGGTLAAICEPNARTRRGAAT